MVINIKMYIKHMAYKAFYRSWVSAVQNKDLKTITEK